MQGVFPLRPRLSGLYQIPRQMDFLKDPSLEDACLHCSFVTWEIWSSLTESPFHLPRTTYCRLSNATGHLFSMGQRHGPITNVRG